MKTIDVTGLPEQVAQALQAVVRSLRGELGRESIDAAVQSRRKVRLRTRPGRVLGQLTREEIYEDL